MGAAAGAVGAGLGIYQAIKGSEEKNNARSALANYKRQELENVQKERTVSTLGANIQREEQARLAATQVSALQAAGTRGLVGGLGRVEVGNQNVNQQIGANLDMQQKEIDAAIAQDDANIRGMQESRENADISALSSQYQSGKQDENTGIGNAVMGVGMLGNSLSAMGQPTTQQEQQQVASTMQPAGFATSPNRMMASPYPTTQFGQFGGGIFSQPRIPQSGYYNR
jgi:hypothetical protein